MSSLLSVNEENLYKFFDEQHKKIMSKDISCDDANFQNKMMMNKVEEFEKASADHILTQRIVNKLSKDVFFNNLRH